MCIRLVSCEGGGVFGFKVWFEDFGYMDLGIQVLDLVEWVCEFEEDAFGLDLDDV